MIENVTIAGSLFAENWLNLTWLVRPHPDADAVDIGTGVFQNPQDIILTVDQFYESIQLEKTNAADNQENVFGLRLTSEMSCQPSTWDLYDEGSR